MKLFIFLFFFVKFLPGVLGDFYWYEGGSIGLIGLVLLILDIIAIYEIVIGHTEILVKVCWILFILFFPFLGFVCYWYNFL